MAGKATDPSGKGVQAVGGTPDAAGVAAAGLGNAPRESMIKEAQRPPHPELDHGDGGAGVAVPRRTTTPACTSRTTM